MYNHFALWCHFSISKVYSSVFEFFKLSFINFNSWHTIWRSITCFSRALYIIFQSVMRSWDRKIVDRDRTWRELSIKTPSDDVCWIHGQSTGTRIQIYLWQFRLPYQYIWTRVPVVKVRTGFDTAVLWRLREIAVRTPWCDGGFIQIFKIRFLRKKYYTINKKWQDTKTAHIFYTYILRLSLNMYSTAFVKCHFFFFGISI